MAEQNKVARARQQIDSALQALSDVGGDTSTSQPAGETSLVAVGETMATSRADTRPNLLRTSTRLIVGAMLLAAEERSRRASGWEQAAADEVSALSQDVSAPKETQAPARIGEAIVAPSADTATRADGQLALAMVGWVFATQERLRLDQDPGQLLQAAGTQHVNSAAALIGESLEWMASG